MNRRFSFKLKDDFVRGMTREQYKSASHWARYTAWIVSQRINWDKFHKLLADSLIYGRSQIVYEDLLI